MSDYFTNIENEFEKKIEGEIYQSLHEFLKEHQKGENWLEELNKTNNSDDLYFLGLIYWKGIEGVEKDNKKAVEYFEKSAEKGDSNSLFFVGNLHRKGDFVKKDLNKTKNYWEKSAQGKEPASLRAMVGLGNLYRGKKKNLFSNQFQSDL